MARSLSKTERKELRRKTGKTGDPLPSENVERKSTPRESKATKSTDKEVPCKKEKSPEDVAKEKVAKRLLGRIDVLRGRALERKIEFPQALEEELRKQTTKGAICRVWKAYLQNYSQART